jgi:putative FmdB family regulatory protein
MPIYDYRCLNCKQRFNVFLTYQEYGTKTVTCSHCNSEQVERRIGRVRFARGDEARMEDISDPSKLAELENDPRAMGRMMRQMSGELGEDMGPEFTELVSRLESGQSPEDIEKSMPNLADDIGGRSPMDNGPAEDLDF